MLAYFWMGAIGVSVLSISFYVLHTLPFKPFLCQLFREGGLPRLLNLQP